MKKFFTFLFICLLSFSLISCKKKDDKPNTPPEVNWVDPNEPVGSNHMIKDANGNFGGSLDASLYGEGAPLNGEHDVLDSKYFAARDYYYTRSTESRTILSKFRPYQQTMQKSDGLACVLMALNYYGEDVRNTYTEKKLLDKYEEVVGETVSEVGTTSYGLTALLNEYGYDAETVIYDEISNDRNENWKHFGNQLRENLEVGNILLMKLTDNNAYSWHAVIGVDNMGTENSVRDDLIIFADPFDNADHKQDGYWVHPLARVYRWWLEVPESGHKYNNFEAVLVKPKAPINITRTTEEEVINPNVPELHLILNKDGTYGGNVNEEIYGAIGEGNGAGNHVNAGYYAMPDYYNMISNANLAILTHYRAYEQRMRSSCGLATAMALLAYNGFEMDDSKEIELYALYEKLTGKTILGVGTGASGILQVLKEYGFEGQSYGYRADDYVDQNSKVYATYQDFAAFVNKTIRENNPIPINWRPVMGHWEAIIGIDNMGTPDYIYDDVIVLADSNDVSDHYQDGYNTYNAVLFYNHFWNGGCSEGQIHYVVNKTK